MPTIRYPPTSAQRKAQRKHPVAKPGTKSRGWLIIEFKNHGDTARKMMTITSEFYVFQEEYTKEYNVHIQGKGHRLKEPIPNTSLRIHAFQKRQELRTHEETVPYRVLNQRFGVCSFKSEVLHKREISRHGRTFWTRR